MVKSGAGSSAVLAVPPGDSGVHVLGQWRLKDLVRVTAGPSHRYRSRDYNRYDFRLFEEHAAAA